MPTTAGNKNIILFGVPRSGSTWVSQVLAAGGGLELVHEPDNEVNAFLGLVLKRGLPRYPYLTAGDSAEPYRLLFDLALHGPPSRFAEALNRAAFALHGLSRDRVQEHLAREGTGPAVAPPLAGFWARILAAPQGARRTLVKTVHAGLAIPFLMKHLDVQGAVMLRNPLNVYSSYVSLDMPDQDRGLDRLPRLTQDFEIPLPEPEARHPAYRAGWQLGVFQRVLRAALESNPGLVAVPYEDLLEDTADRFRALFARLDLEYSPKVEAFIASRFKPGAGYTTKRDPAGQREIYKKRLSAEQIDRFTEGYVQAAGDKEF